MNDLDTRLRSLRTAPVPDGAAPDALRRRATRHTRQRRVAAAAVVVPVLIVAALVAATVVGGEPAQQVRTDPGPGQTSAPSPSTTEAPATPPTAPGPEGTRILGDVEGVSVDVTPRTGLHDRDVVEVTVDGLENLPGATIFMCSGDVTADDAATACDGSAVQKPGTEAQVEARADQTVSVSTGIEITRGAADPNIPEPYDCATEPAGCVLAVGPFELPPRAVLVPLTLVDGGAATEPSLTVSPDRDLAAAQSVELTADGLRPNGSFRVGICLPGESFACDEGDELVVATSDGEGRLRASVTVRAAIYSQRGRTDCTATTCTVAVVDRRLDTAASAPITFAAGVVAPVPHLEVTPEGPYVEDQQVTVAGTGFSPGFDVGRWLGICPVDLDTSIKERCTYPNAFTPVVVEDDGTFTTEMQLAFSLLVGRCGVDVECHLGWVLTNGPTVATTPLPTTG